MNSNQTNISWMVCISMVFVWFTSQFGGGWASGMQAYQWFALHGWMGLFTPLIGMAIIAGIGYITLEYARIYQVWNYRDFMESLYGKAWVAVVHEIIMLIGCLISAGALVATAGSTAEVMLGVNFWVAVAVFSAVVVIGCMYGEAFVRQTATVMGVGIIILLMIIFAVVVGARGHVISTFVAERQVFTSWREAMFNAFKFGAVTGGMVLAILPVMQKIKNSRESKVVAIGGFLSNSMLVVAISYIVLAFMPDVVGEPVPMLYAAANLELSWMIWVYVVVMYLALITTGIGMLYTYVVRFDPYLQDKIKNEKARAALVIIVVMGLASAVSAAGLFKIIATGFNMIAVLNLPLVTLGIPIIGIYKICRKRQEEKLASVQGSTLADS